jgi:hypothetical protein
MIYFQEIDRTQGMHKMKRTGALAAAIFLTTSVSAFAQFKTEGLLDRGPIRFGAGLDLQLNKFGRNVTGTATVFAAIRDAQGVIDATIPELNRRLACGKGRTVGVAIARITPSTNATFSQSSPFALTITAHVATCPIPLVAGDISVSIPVEVIVRNSSVTLEVPSPRVRSLGVTAVGFVPIPNDVISSNARRRMAPQVGRVLAIINKWVNRQIQLPALQRQIGAHKLQIRSARIDFDGNDLSVALTLSGQTSVARVRRWLNF